MTRPVVSYPQILELKDLSCFVRLPGQYPVTKLSFVIEERQTNHAGFIERQLPDMPRLARAASSSKREDKVGSDPQDSNQALFKYKPSEEQLIHYMD